MCTILDAAEERGVNRGETLKLIMMVQKKIKKHARVRAKESRGTRGQLVDTWLSRAIEQEAPTSKSGI